jgi:AAA family ATP:ADP antiporter
MNEKPLPSILTRLVPVRRQELPAMLWSFAYFFCLLCSYYILRPVRDEMGIQGGVGNLQWLFTGTFLSMISVVPIFGWLSSRFPRRRLLPVVYFFFAANLLIFFGLFEFRIAPTFAARAFFIWVSVFNLFVVSVFWSFMADLFRNEQARRLFGFISAGGSAGALAGPTITASLAADFGPAAVLPVSAGLLLAAVFCIARLSAWAERARGNKPDARAGDMGEALGGGILAGITLVLKSPYLIGICIYVMLGTLLGTFLYFQQAYIVEAQINDPGARTVLFANIDLAVNVLTLVCQMFLVNRLIGKFGVGATLMILPAMAVVGFLFIGMVPTLAVLIGFQVIRRAGEYAVAKPAREVLFTVLTREEKYKSKNVIDTAVFRGGDAVSGWIFEGLRILGFGFSAVAFTGIPIALLWIGTGWMLGRTQDEMRARYDATMRRYEKSLQLSAQASPEGAAGGGPAGGDGQAVVR